jgi:hypothetical protein
MSEALGLVARSVSHAFGRAWSLLNIWDDTDDLYPRNPSDQLAGIDQAATSYRIAGTLAGW